MSRKRIVQFGDKLNEVFVFSPFEEEESIPLELDPALIDLPGQDGSYRARGMGRSRMPARTVTKRFVLHSKTLYDLSKIKDKGFCGDSICNNKGYHMTDFIDYMYRTLLGGVKKLYMVTEDGRVRYAFAEAVSAPLEIGVKDSLLSKAFSIDFLLHDGYWHEVDDGDLFLYKNIPLVDLVCGCQDEVIFNFLQPTSIININHKDCFNSCDYEGLMIKNPDLVGILGEECQAMEECIVDPVFFGKYGNNYSIPSADEELQICVRGSAGSSRPIIGFWNKYIDPTATNLTNGCTISYDGNIQEGEYLVIDLGSAENGELEDFEIFTNISGFDRNDITISDDGFFDLENNINIFQIEGADSETSSLSLKWTNKYYN